MKKLLPIYCLLAGACDTLTGILLVSAPLFTLKLMGISTLPDETIYLRFVGAFVGAVGLTYFYPFTYPASSKAERKVAFEIMLGITALVRLAVGSFVAAAVARSSLGAPWLTVAVTDLALAAFQIVIVQVGLVQVFFRKET